MDPIEFLKAQKSEHTSAAEEIIAAAKEEKRDMNEDERKLVQNHTSKATEFAHAITVAEEKALADGDRKLGRSLASEPGEGGTDRPRSITEAVTKSESYAKLRARGVGGVFAMDPVNVPNELFGAVAGVVTEGTGTNADVFLPQRIPGIQGPVEPAVAVTDLFGQGTIANGNAVLLVRETVTDNNAAVVAEGGPKPPSDIGFSTESVTLTKIATMIKVSSEFLEDEPGLETYLDERLRTFVRQAREDAIIVQLLAQAGQAATESDIGGMNLFDAILAGAVKVRQAGGLDADAVVMNMLTFAELAVEKTGQDVYYSGGPFGASSQLLWGRYQVAIADRLADGDIVVGAFKQGGTVWRKRQGVTVDATNSNEDDFKNNLTAIRAEERAVLFLQRPDAFAIVSASS